MNKDFQFDVSPANDLTINVGRLKLFRDVDTCIDNAADASLINVNVEARDLHFQVTNIYLGRIMRIGQGLRYRAMLYILARPKHDPQKQMYASFPMVFNTSIDSGKAFVDSCLIGKGEIF